MLLVFRRNLYMRAIICENIGCIMTLTLYKEVGRNMCGRK